MSPAALTEPPAVSARSSFDVPDDVQKQIIHFCRMLSDATRLRILMYLARENELHVTALCQRLNQSQPAVSHHLALLRVAGLIEARRDGKHNFYSVSKPCFQMILGHLLECLGDQATEELRIDDYVLCRN